MAEIMPSVKNQEKRDTLGINEKLMRIKTKWNSDLLLQRSKNRAVGWIQIFRERRCAFSLDFRSLRPSILDGARSKVDLRCEGYAWTLIWWVPTTLRGRDLFLLVLFLG